MDNYLTVNVHNKADARSRGNYCLLLISVQHCHIINVGFFLRGGPPAARRGDICMVPLQDWLLLTASLPLQKTSPQAGFQGGVYGDNMIAMKSSSDVSSDLNEWSHSWAMRKPKIKIKISINNVYSEMTPLRWDKNKLTVAG